MYSLSHTRMHMIGSGIYNWILLASSRHAKKKKWWAPTFWVFVVFLFLSFTRFFFFLSLLIAILAFKDEVHDLQYSSRPWSTIHKRIICISRRSRVIDWWTTMGYSQVESSRHCFVMVSWYCRISGKLMMHLLQPYAYMTCIAGAWTSSGYRLAIIIARRIWLGRSRS